MDKIEQLKLLYIELTSSEQIIDEDNGSLMGYLATNELMSKFDAVFPELNINPPK